MYAIKGKKLENVELLLDSGADVEKTDKDGKISGILSLHCYIFLLAVQSCCSPGVTSMCNLLIHGEVTVSAHCCARFLNHQDNVFTFAGFSPLHIAAHHGSTEIVQLIFDRAQSPDPLSSGNVTPLCLASKFNSPDVGKHKLLKDLLSQDGGKEKLSSSFSIFVLRRRNRVITKKHHAILIQFV